MLFTIGTSPSYCVGIRLQQATPNLAREFNANQLSTAEWRSKFNLFRRAMSDDGAEKQRNLSSILPKTRKQK